MPATEPEPRAVPVERSSARGRSGLPVPWSIVALTAATAIGVVAGTCHVARPKQPAPLVIVATAP